MKCLYISFMLFAYNYITWSQVLSFPTDGETSQVSSNFSGNSTELCPEGMFFYEEDIWECDCKSQFLYFPLNDSCYRAYSQDPCPPKNYIILPEDEIVPRCVENPCLEDGLVPYNDTCYPFGTRGPCASTEILDVNKNTFQLECIRILEERKGTTPYPLALSPFGPFVTIINMPTIYTTSAPGTIPDKPCRPGSRRSTQGKCKKVSRA